MKNLKTMIAIVAIACSFTFANAQTAPAKTAKPATTTQTKKPMAKKGTKKGTKMAPKAKTTAPKAGTKTAPATK